MRRRWGFGWAGAVAAAAGLLAATATAPAAADAPAPVLRTGTTAGGVPFVLQGRRVWITVPARTRRGRRIDVRCGRLTTADLAPTGIGLSDSSIASASRVFRNHRRMRLILNRDVAATAEWCDFDTQPRGPSGAAVLRPRVSMPPAPLRSGPGVREGTAQGGRARFLLDGPTLTLRTDRKLPADIVLFLGCYVADPQTELRLVAVRAVAIGGGRRAVTVNMGTDVESSATSCLAEDSTGGGGDLFYTQFEP